MFSSAFKSFSSNIGSNYDISKQSTTTVGPWTVFDAKKKSNGASASVFVFDRKSLDVNSGGFGARTSATSLRKVQDEVVERLRKEAANLARLRHPSILQLVEPVEDTRHGGLTFATEPVLASLSAALAQKDSEDDGGGKRSVSRSVSDDPGGTSKALAEIELDELEIQKGLLQVAKGLEFLHDSAKLVHGNLTPDAIMINAKSDWKISGLSFAGPADGAEGHQGGPQISLSEALYHDPRIPSTVQLNLDYTSPDFVLDSNINFAADMYSLGLVVLACYRRPHASPIEAHGNQSTYKKIFGNASTTPSSANNFLCTDTLPRELGMTLPRVLARRPAQRLTATEFQQSEYFDNILVNTMRFLDAFPAKTPAEKSQFMRGLGRVIPQFPPSVLAKKVLSVLLDEMKDRELLALILQNMFKIVKITPSSRELVSEQVLPRLREIFLTKSKTEERDTSKEAGLLTLLANIQLIAENCSARQFKDDVLPIVHVAMESSTPSLTDAALHSLPIILPLIDFSTVKHDLFPVVASVFSKTNSLSIKIRGLEALGVLCGVPAEDASTATDDLSGVARQEKPEKAGSSLDKFTMQEKVIPLLKAIKTKEPAVMMAALKVFRQVGQVADVDFLAIEVMPILWSFALGPLLDLTQFQAYMDVIKSLSAKIEREQTRKLQELATTKPPETRVGSAAGTSAVNGVARVSHTSATEDDFERLVLGSKAAEKKDVFEGTLSDGQRLTQNPPSLTWSSASTASNNLRSLPAFAPLQPQPMSRSITPDVSISAFPSLQPTQASSASPSQPPQHSPHQPLQPSNYMSNFTLPPPPSSNTWQAPSRTSFTPALAPPPPQRNAWQQTSSNVGSAPLNASFSGSMPALIPQTNVQNASQQQKSGLDKYQSLL